MEEPGKEGKSHELDATSLPAVGVDKSWGVAKVGVESSEFSEPIKIKGIFRLRYRKSLKWKMELLQWIFTNMNSKWIVKSEKDPIAFMKNA